MKVARKALTESESELLGKIQQKSESERFSKKRKWPGKIWQKMKVRDLVKSESCQGSFGRKVKK